MASNIIQGTLGNPDWTYLDANPLVTATNVNAYEPYNALTYMLTYDEIVKYYNLNSVDQMLYNKSLYATTSALKKQVTFYKCAFYHERNLFNNTIKTYHLYYNKNGEIVNGLVEIGGENYYPFQTIYPTSATNFTSYPGQSLVVRDVGSNYGQTEGWYCGKIPVFMDWDQLKTWLGNDSVDYESAGGAIYEGTDPIEPTDPGETSDPIEGVSDYVGMGSADGMVRMFTCDDENYKNLGTIVGTGWLSGNIGEAIIANKVIRTPGIIPELKLEQVIIDPIGSNAVSGRYLTKQICLYEMGTYKFGEEFNNFFDYAPYTQLQIYLPYCGLQRLDPEVVMGNTIKITCGIDFFTGNVIYYCEVQSKEGNSTLYTWNGNCAIDVAITAEDYGRKVTAFIGMAGTVAATVATGGVGGAIAAASGAATFANDSSKHMITGSIISNNGFSGIQYPYIVVTKPRPINVTKYGHNVGYRCDQTYVLGELSGYTVVENVHLENMGDCTIDELKEIESLLKEGVIF